MQGGASSFLEKQKICISREAWSQMWRDNGQELMKYPFSSLKIDWNLFQKKVCNESLDEKQISQKFLFEKGLGPSSSSDFPIKTIKLFSWIWVSKILGKDFFIKFKKISNQRIFCVFQSQLKSSSDWEFAKEIFFWKSDFFSNIFSFFD